MARLIETMRTGRGAALAGLALFLAGSGVGAGAMYAARPVAAMAPVAIRPIATLATDAPLFGARIASVRGRVAEVYGSRFTLKDASGTALVEAGRRGGDGIVAPGQTVTVQGRFGDGVLRAAYLVGADGSVTALDPRGGPGRGPRHHRAGPDGVPPPPPSSASPRPAPPAPPADDADGPAAP